MRSLLRSGLITPGNDERLLAKAAASAADFVHIELEDGIPAEDKARAREIVRESLTRLPWGDKLTLVRVNARETGFLEDDIASVTPGRPTAFLQGKAQGPQDLVYLDGLITRAERRAGRNSTTTAGLLIGLFAGSATFSQRNFDPAGALEVIEEVGATHQFGVAPMFAMELAEPSFDRARVRTLRYLRTTWLTGDDAGPRRVPYPAVDVATALLAAVSILAVTPGGQGTRIAVSMTAAAALLEAPLILAAATGAQLAPGGGNYFVFPNGIYPGRYGSVALAAFDDVSFASLADALDLSRHPLWSADMATAVGRLRLRDAVDQVLGDAMAGRAGDDILAISERSGAACSRVNSLFDALQLPDVRALVQPLGDSSVIEPVLRIPLGGLPEQPWQPRSGTR